MCHKSYLGCLTGLLLLRVNLSGPLFPWQLPTISPLQDYPTAPWGDGCDTHGLPKLQLHSVTSLSPVGLNWPALPGCCTHRTGQPVLSSTPWTGMPRKIADAWLLKCLNKSGTNEITSPPTLALFFLFSFIFLCVLCSHVQSLHTHFTAY